ncbi:PucR family transcriptional regulator ligand-binding domain-containing protein [Clostridiaceae bacterium HSG29]|nr:PucR family transcriptional regulator ligand-binding domain-containing protein [Clostridiaceae bacterium HSG29]
MKLFELLDIAKEHGISLIAGEKGINNNVKWFRVMENTEIVEYMDEELLLFTTGVAIHSETELIDLVKMQHIKNSSATVLHIGRNIKKIPDELIEYCNNNNYPLLWVPWENSLPRMMKDFSMAFIESEDMGKDLENALKNSIKFPEKVETYVPTFCQYGYYEDEVYNIVIFEFTDLENLPNKNEYTQIFKTIERILIVSGDRSFAIDGNGSLLIMFSGYSMNIINQITSRILKALNTTGYEFIVGMSKNLKGITKIAESYTQAMWCVKMSRKQKKTNCIIHFEDIGIYKILSSVKEKKILRDYYNETIDVLDKYDKMKGTNYKELLKLYISNNRSVQTVADLLYMHRNTVNYKISKIEEILNCDLSQMEVRMQLYMAFCIESFF